MYYTQLKSTIAALEALLPAEEKVSEVPLPQRAAQQASSNSTSKVSATPAVAWGKSGSSPVARKTQQAFEKVMGFDGYAPEIINGRAAMLGFLAALVGEVGNGESLSSQLVGGGAGSALLLILAVTAASFAPAVRQVP